MVIDFSKIDLRKRPTFILRNLNGDAIGVLHNILNPTGSFNYNDLSEIQFDYPSQIDGEKLKAVKTDPFIICTTFYNNSWEHLLAAFIHEFSHIIKGAINGCHISKDKNYSIFTTRCGLSIFKLIYDKNKNEFSQNVSYEILDEVINCAHTNDIMKQNEAEFLCMYIIDLYKFLYKIKISK